MSDDQKAYDLAELMVYAAIDSKDDRAADPATPGHYIGGEWYATRRLSAIVTALRAQRYDP